MLHTPQRKDEKPRRDGDESRKKCVDGARLNPKHYIMGNQQPSSEQEKAQRLSRKGVGTSVPKWWAPRKRMKI